MFYRIDLDEVNPDDYLFIMQQYFQDQAVEQNIINKYQYYSQCSAISELFEYRLYDKSDEQLLCLHAAKALSSDMNPKFITMELLSHLQTYKIIRPKYTALQTIVSGVINTERKRLANIIQNNLTEQDTILLQSLLIEEDTLSKLAAIKQDAKDFKASMMKEEKQKMETLKQIYQITRRLMPHLELSQQNMHYYANLINYYTIHDLRKRLKVEQTYLYLLCYSWKRYQQIIDNLVSAFCYHFKQLEHKIKESSKAKFSEHVISQHDYSIKMRSLVQLYIDNTLPDDMNFGLVRSKAFLILPREALVSTLSSTNKPQEEVDFYWQTIDNFKRPIKSNLRYLVESLDFSSTNEENSWLEAIKWIKTEFSQSNRPALEVSHCPNKTIPVKLQHYLTTNNGDKEAQINPHRYEYSIYRRLNEYLKTGKIYLEDSLQHRSLTQELVSLEEKDELIKQLNIPALNRPITEQLHDLFRELGQLWESFNKKLNKGELKHLRYDKKIKHCIYKKSKLIKTNKLSITFLNNCLFVILLMCSSLSIKIQDF